MAFTFQEIIDSTLFKKTFRDFVGDTGFEIVRRSACFVIHAKNEDPQLKKRIVVLPPRGFSANEITLLNPHPEARKARVYIMGKINPTKKGFQPLIRGVRLNYSLTRNIPTEKISPYAKYAEKHCGSHLKSWRNWFYVVKENGWGNFHNLINLSHEWLIVLLEKTLIDQKKINIKPYLTKLPASWSKKLKGCLKMTKRAGDAIFDNKTLITETLRFPPHVIVPILVQMLNVQETGRHEPCTFFALLLKIGKKHRSLVLEEVNRAMESNLAPYYYLNDLVLKLK